MSGLTRFPAAAVPRRTPGLRRRVPRRRAGLQGQGIRARCLRFVMRLPMRPAAVGSVGAPRQPHR